MSLYGKSQPMSSSLAVGFDFDHTLGLDHQIERTVALAMLADFARDQGVRYAIADAEGAIDGVLERYRSGDLSVETAIAGFFERFVPVGNSIADRASDFRDAVIARVPEFVRARPETEALLATLDAMGVRYALLTNGWSPLQEEKGRLIGFRGPVYVSERIGVRKPHPDAFALLAKHFEVPVDELWYVGDDPHGDIAGAAALGITTVWYEEAGASFPEDLTRPKHTIRSLAELPDILRAALDQGRHDEATNLAG